MTGAAMPIASGIATRAVVGNVVFLRQKEHDQYLLGQIARVAARRNIDGSCIFFVLNFERMSADWLAGLKFVVSRDGRLELHEVSQMRLTNSGCLVRIVTNCCGHFNRRRRLDSGCVIFITALAERIVRIY